MASLTPAAVQNENLHIHRGKVLEGAKTGIVQNENLHIHRGKGVEGFKAEVPKPVKTGLQERKALRDLSKAGQPLTSAAAKGKSAATALKDKSAATALKDKAAATALKDKAAAPSRETAKKAAKSNILTDEEIAKCREWAKEGIEHVHFTGNDMQKFEAQKQEERVKRKVDKALSAFRAWTDMTFGLEIPVKEVPSDTEDVLKLDFEPEEVPSDTEDVLKLDFEPEVLPPTPRTNRPPKSGYEEIEDLFELDYDSLYLNQQFEMKLKEEDESDTLCF